MSEVETKLECVKLAVALGAGPGAVKVAAEIYAFVAGSSTEREERGEPVSKPASGTQ